MNRLIDMTGRKFGALRVIRYSHKSAKGDHYWMCECACKTQKSIYGSHLRSGKITSCGCNSTKAIEMRQIHAIRKIKEEHRKAATIPSVLLDWLYSKPICEF